MSPAQKTTLRFIDRELRRIQISTDNVITSYPLNALPDLLFERLVNIADNRPDDENELGFIWNNPVTKPGICTMSQGNPFAVNFAPKIIRLTLTDYEINRQIDEIEGEILALSGRPFEETIEERLALHNRLFMDESKVDRFRLGAIEMYGSATYMNLLADPRACAGFVWREENTKTHLGFQINCIVEIIEPEKPYYRYMRALRGLFSSRYLDLKLPDYVCAYKLWISEVKTKHLEDRIFFAPPPPEQSD